MFAFLIKSRIPHTKTYDYVSYRYWRVSLKRQQHAATNRLSIIKSIMKYFDRFVHLTIVLSN